MTRTPDTEGPQNTPDGSAQGTSEIVISGLDDQGAQSGAAENVTPTDKAVQLLNSQRPRGEPEDEDG